MATSEEQTSYLISLAVRRFVLAKTYFGPLCQPGSIQGIELQPSFADKRDRAVGTLLLAAITYHKRTTQQKRKKPVP